MHRGTHLEGKLTTFGTANLAQRKVVLARVVVILLGCDYGQTQKLGSHAGEPGNPDGVQSITDVMIGHPAPSK